MKITIKQESWEREEDELITRICAGISSYINWLQITDAYRKIWSKYDLEMYFVNEPYSLPVIVVEGDSKYEQIILQIIENAKNGAYDIW